VYPGYAFTPDDSNIIIWAHGNIFFFLPIFLSPFTSLSYSLSPFTPLSLYSSLFPLSPSLWEIIDIYSIAIPTGTATQIPFSVDVQLAISPTVRFSNPAEDGLTFSTKVITSPSVSLFLAPTLPYLTLFFSFHPLFFYHLKVAGNQVNIAFTALATTYRMSFYLFLFLFVCLFLFYFTSVYETTTGIITPLSPTPLADGAFQFHPSISNNNNFLVQVRRWEWTRWGEERMKVKEGEATLTGNAFGLPLLLLPLLFYLLRFIYFLGSSWNVLIGIPSLAVPLDNKF
jgi:hypothetical protein